MAISEETRLFGKKILYADYTEDQIKKDIITDILIHIFNVHLKNASEIDYLEKYYRRFQPILVKVKELRPMINNRVIENNAYYIVEFKKSFVFGKPIQYVQRGDIAKDEVRIFE